MKYLRFFCICAISTHMMMASEMFEELSVGEYDEHGSSRAINVTPVNHEPFTETDVVIVDHYDSRVDDLSAAMADMSVSRASTPRLVTPRPDAYVVVDASEQTLPSDIRESCEDMVAHLKAFFNPVLCMDFRKEGREAGCLSYG